MYVRNLAAGQACAAEPNWIQDKCVEIAAGAVCASASVAEPCAVVSYEFCLEENVEANETVCKQKCFKS